MNTKILLTAVNAKYIHSNLAVYSLRAYAKEYKALIELAEYTINNRTEDILSDIYRRKPSVLCFSCYIWNISYVLEAASEFHKLCPEVPIWVGGPEVSYEVEDFLRKHPFITGVMMGEGEKVFKNICAYYVDHKGSLHEMKGIAFCNKTEQEKAQYGDIEIHDWEDVMDMNEIPFCYEESIDFSNRIIYYESSRGCPFSCSYCLSSVEKKLRFRRLELVEKELQFFLDKKVLQVKFVDRTFNCEKKHAMAVWRYIKEHDNGITNFHFEIAADLLTEDETALIADMRPGLIQLEIGVQTTNPATIGEIHRHMDLDEVKRIVKRVQKPGNVHQHLDLIAGLPLEDYKTFRHSFDEIYALKPEQLQLGFLKVLKGSYMYEHAAEYELVVKTHPPYEVLKTKWLSYEDILNIKLAEEMLEVYYNSAQFLMSILLLEREFDSAYEMFEQLGHYYENNGYLKMSHSRMRRCEILLAFIEELGVTDMELYRQAAVYDIYSRENAKSRPKWAYDVTEWKTLTRHFIRSGKQFHVERFDYCFYGNEIGRKCDTYYILFDYEDRDVRNHQAKTEILDVRGVEV